MFCHRNDNVEYDAVASVRCGQKTAEKTRPLLIEAEHCFANCRHLETDIFDAIVNVSTWNLPENGKGVKRNDLSKLLYKARPPAFYCIDSIIESIYFQKHLRATVHDRSAAAIKKMIVNGENLSPATLETEEDLATKLGLRRSPQLLVDFWPTPGQASSTTPLVNPTSTSAAYYYIEGDEPMDWILLPTNAG